jgi:hypothetical protein
MRLEYTTVADGEVLDHITIDAESVTYETGAARDVVTGLAVLAGSDLAAARLLSSGWSNGYVTIRPT